MQPTWRYGFRRRRGTPPRSWKTGASTTPTGSGSGWSGYTIRVKIAAAQLSNIDGASKVRVTLYAGSGGSAQIGAVYFGYAAGSGDSWDFAAAPTQMLNDGLAGGTIGIGSTDTWECDFSGVAGQPILFAFQMSGTTQLAYQSIATGYNSWYKLALDASTQDATGYSVDVADEAVGLVEFYNT